MPRNGVSDLPKNFFVSKFLLMKELSSEESKTSPCEACSGDEESESEVQNVASVYCVECQMKLCQICERGHKAIKLTRLHKLVQIGDKISVESLYQSMPPSYCDQHEDESLKIYCFDCKMAICMMCYIELHNTHKCSNINKVENAFRKQIESCVDSISNGVEKCGEMLESLQNEKNDFAEQIARKGKQVCAMSEQLRKIIEDNRERLMNELSSMKQKRMEEIESLREEIERQLRSMKSYKKYLEEVRQKGTACDIARTSNGLHDRADELLKFDVIERTLADLGHHDVTFTSSPYYVKDDVSKILEQVCLYAVKGGESNIFYCIRVL